jgi:hypothetical protein
LSWSVRERVSDNPGLATTSRGKRRIRRRKRRADLDINKVSIDVVGAEPQFQVMYLSNAITVTATARVVVAAATRGTTGVALQLSLLV